MAKKKKGGKVGAFLAHLDEKATTTPTGLVKSEVANFAGTLLGRGQQRRTLKALTLAEIDGDEPDKELD